MALSFSLKKRFRDFSFDIDLSIGEGITVLFGPSGAGKSLLLNMVSGIVSPDEGVVTIDHIDVFRSSEGIDMPIRCRRVGHLFQDYALFPHMTVYQNIAYGISRLQSSELRRRVGELMELMRLSGLRDRYPDEISGGQRQRTALARTLATEPRVLLLDEPFSALDYQVREKLRADLATIHERYPITMLFVTHDLEEAFIMGENIAVVNDGGLEQFGPRDEVFYRPGTRNVARFIGTRNIFSGRVSRVEEDGTVVLECDEMGEVRTAYGGRVRPARGAPATFAIRPEEIMVIRPDRPIDRRVRDNVLDGSVVSATARGTSHTLFFQTADGRAKLKIEMPNSAYRKVLPFMDGTISVSLKKESIWILPDARGE